MSDLIDKFWEEFAAAMAANAASADEAAGRALARIVADAKAEERERCAKLCDESVAMRGSIGLLPGVAGRLAEKIRSGVA